MKKIVLIALISILIPFVYVYCDSVGPDFFIKPKFWNAGDFHCDMARIMFYNSSFSKADLYGYIDMTGKEVIPPKFLAARNFSEDLAAVYFKDEWSNERVGFLNKKGEFVYRSEFEIQKDALSSAFKDVPALRDFHCGRALIKQNNYGPVYIDINGKIVIDKSLDKPARALSAYSGDFSENLAVFASYVKTNSGIHKPIYGYIDLKGNFVIKAQFEKAFDFSEGLAIVENTSGANQMINNKGQIIKTLPADISLESKKFIGGLLKFEKNGRYGFLDKSGNIAIQPKFEDVTDFHDGLARVKTLSPEDNTILYGYIDTKGDLIIRPNESILPCHEEKGDFVNGYAIIRGEEGFGLINKKGQVVFEPNFIGLGNVHEGVIAACNETINNIIENYGYIKMPQIP